MSEDSRRSPLSGRSRPTAELPPVRPLETGQAGRRQLLVFDREKVHKVPLVEGQEVVLGRGLDADVILSDDGVSRRHLRVGLSDGTVWAEDLGSRNGCQINGRVFRRAVVRMGDSIAMGSTAMTLQAPPSLDSPPQGMVTHDQFMQLLDYEVRRTKHLGGVLGLLLVRPAQGGAVELQRAYPTIQPALGPTDLMALYAHNAVEIALVQTDRSRVSSLARRIVEDAATALAEPVELCCAVALLPASATSTESLVAAANDALRRAAATAPIVWASGVDAEPTIDATRDALPVPGDDQPVVVNPAMEELFALGDKVARADMPVLITGETGTGKEVLARAIHRRGDRHNDPFVAVNCGALPPGLVESTLFGHKKGAFTGAGQDARGVFEAAHRGSLFLDEIGELPAAAQAALLRVLQNKRVTRVGSTKEREVDVRVITATHRDLESMSQSGGFRQDLLYRLNTVVLDIPPLRRRRDEIAPLAKRFVQRCSQTDEALQELSPDAESALRAYDWPGNVRQLSNVIERAMCLASGNVIGVSDLPAAIRVKSRELSSAVRPTSRDLAAALGPLREELSREFDQVEQNSDSDSPPDADFKSRIQEIETRMILDALRRNDWNQTKAAAYLQIPPRTMTRKMRTYGIGKLGFDKLDD